MHFFLLYLILIQYIIGNGVTDPKEAIQTAEGTGKTFVALSQGGSAKTVLRPVGASISGSAKSSFERPELPCQPSWSNDVHNHQGTLALQVLPSSQQTEGNPMWHMRHCVAEVLRQLLCPQPAHAVPGDMYIHWMERGRQDMGQGSQIVQIAKEKIREVTKASQEEQRRSSSARFRSPMECQRATACACGQFGRQRRITWAGRTAAAEPCCQAQRKGDVTESGGGGADHCGYHDCDSDVKEYESGSKETRPSKRAISKCSKRTTQSSQQMEFLHRGEREKMEVFRGRLCFQRCSTGRQSTKSERNHDDRQDEPREDQGAPFKTGRSVPRSCGGAVRDRGRHHESGVSRSNPERNCVYGEQLGHYQGQASRRGKRRSQCGQETKTSTGRPWLCLIAAFWKAGQVDSHETCPRQTNSLCFHDSQHRDEMQPAIWNHSILEEDCFLNPWQASICALDLSYEVGTWRSCSTWQLVEGSRKAHIKSVTFANDVELYVGHEFDIEMTRCMSTLSTPSTRHHIFQPAIHLASNFDQEEDDDASFLAVHAAHLRDFEHADINMDPAFARDPQEHDLEDPVDHTSDSESSYEQSPVDRPPRRDQWRSTMIFAINHDAVARVIDWDDYHLMHNSIAAAVQVDVVDLLNFHHVETQPQDLRRANVEAVIAHRLQDVQPGDQRAMVLLDVEFHSVNPQHPPETVRKVHKFSNDISRQRILELLGLQAFCKRSRNRCLLWVNDDLIPMETKYIVLYDGDYVRIALPPGGPRIDHIATRCLASAFSQGYTVNEILERHTFYMLGWYDTIIGSPHVPLAFYQEDHDVHALLQQGSGKLLPALDQGLPELRHWHIHGQEQVGGVCARLEDDEIPQQDPTRMSQWHQRVDHPEEQDIERQPPIVQELFMTLAQYVANNPVAAEEDFIVHTWYLDGLRHLKCTDSRSLILRRDFVMWMRMITDAWLDHIDPGQALQIFLVRPSPPLTHRQRSQAAHVILVQNLPIDGFANLFTIVTANSEVIQFAKFAPAVMHKPNVVVAAETDATCLPIVRDTTCMTWHGDFEIRARVAIRNRHGHSYLVIINNDITRDQSSATNPWDEERHDEASFLQHPIRKTILNLETLIPQKVAVQLLDATETKQLPTPLEVDAPGTPAQVEAELQLWGQRCQVFSNTHQARMLCISRQITVSDQECSLCHYWFCHDDPGDYDGTFLHSTPQEMSEIELMSFLCSLGYQRAVILEQKQLREDWRQVVFHHREPTMPLEAAIQKQRSPWPPRGMQTRTAKPFIDFTNQAIEQPHCCLATGFDEEDLRELFASSKNMLCTNFDVLELPTEISQELQQYPILSSFEVSDLDHFDRLLIFTDGSSKPSMRMLEPQHADDLGHPDTWAFIVAAERYVDSTASEIVILGWTAHPIRYDDQGAAFMDIRRIGSDMAERAGLISAAMWRLSLNHQIPTVICTDSDVGGKQAFGLIGVQQPEESYKLMRSLFQALELGLPQGALLLHHTRSHAGDFLNEIADIAAKREAKQSLNLPRQQLDLRHWRCKLKALWVLFGHKIGLPQWRQGFLDIKAPDLPAMQLVPHGDDHSVTPDSCAVEHYALSLATANVQSLYRGQEGHAGKLQYLQEQMRHHNLNCMAIQEARSEAGMSCANDILRLCGGHRGGQYGIEIWIDLTVPYAWSPKGKQKFFHRTHFQCIHHEPRSMLIRCDAPELSFWLLALHAPHSGYPLQERELWWSQVCEVLRQHHDGATLFVLGDTNAAPGQYDGVTVLQEGFSSSASTSLLKNFLLEFNLYLPATSEVHTGPNGTWIDFSGEREHCIDHVALPQQWHDRCVGSYVLHDFDLATLHEDHHVAAVQMQWAALVYPQGPRPHERPKSKPSTYHHDPSIADQLAQIEVLPWHADVERQAQHITQQLHNVMQHAHEQPAAQIKKTYITAETWSLRQTKCQLKKKLKLIKQRRKRDLLHMLFAVWRGAHTDRDDEYHTNYVNMLQCRALQVAARLHATSKALKKDIIESKQRALRQKIEEFTVNTPASEVLRQLKGFIGPTNPKKHKQKMLPIVRDEHGEVCQLPGEAVAVWSDSSNRWKEENVCPISDCAINGFKS